MDRVPLSDGQRTFARRGSPHHHHHDRIGSRLIDCHCTPGPSSLWLRPSVGHRAQVKRQIRFKLRNLNFQPPPLTELSALVLNVWLELGAAISCLGEFTFCPDLRAPVRSIIEDVCGELVRCGAVRVVPLGFRPFRVPPQPPRTVTIDSLEDNSNSHSHRSIVDDPAVSRAATTAAAAGRNQIRTILWAFSLRRRAVVGS